MSHEPVVSVVIPGHGPKATLRGAVRSRPAQTDPWRAIVTSDDGVGRLAVLERAGSRHDWLLQVSTGACERGEGNAGNVALAPARSGRAPRVEAELAYPSEGAAGAA